MGVERELGQNRGGRITENSERVEGKVMAESTEDNTSSQPPAPHQSQSFTMGVERDPGQSRGGMITESSERVMGKGKGVSRINKFKDMILWNTILPAYLAGVTRLLPLMLEDLFSQNNNLKMTKNLIHVHNASP